MRVAELWERFWFRETPLSRLALFRIAILVLGLADFLAYSSTALRDAAAVSAGTIHKGWTPIYLFEVLRVGPIGIEGARAVQVAALVCFALGIVGCFSRAACLGAAALSTYWTGLVYSFGKVHHDKVALTFALWALPLAPVGARLSVDALVARWRRRRRGEEPSARPGTSPFAGVPIRLTQVTIALGYFFAGWTKLAVSGIVWANGYSLMGMIARYDNVLSGAATRSALLCGLMSVVTLAVQCLFPLALFWPRSRWLFLPGALVFHLGTWKTMDTGPYVTLWFCLVAFLPLERIPAWTRAGLASGSLARRAATAAVVAAPLALSLYVLYLMLPKWTLPAALIGLAAYFARMGRAESPRPLAAG